MQLTKKIEKTTYDDAPEDLEDILKESILKLTLEERETLLSMWQSK